MTGVYKILNTTTDKYYVGSSNDIGFRLSYHKTLLRNRKHFNKHLQNSWNKYGEDCFNFRVEYLITIKNPTDKQILQLEQKYLDIAKNEKYRCYNQSFIAGKVEMTDAVKRKISETKKERMKDKKLHPFFGMKHTEESKHKMSLSHTGKKLSENAKSKIRGSNSVAHRNDVKESKKKWWNELRKNPIKYFEFCKNRTIKSVQERVKKNDRKKDEIINY